MGRHTRLSEEAKMKILKLYTIDKLSISTIVKRFGSSYVVIRKLLKEAGVFKPVRTTMDIIWRRGWGD